VPDRVLTLRATLGFLALEKREPAPQLLHRCFDTWRGIGDVVAGMARQEYDLELRRYNGQGWRAMFFASRFEHSLPSVLACPLFTTASMYGADRNPSGDEH
jgi:hypothetical protein